MLLKDAEKVLDTIKKLNDADKAGKIQILKDSDSEFKTFLKLCLDDKYSFKVTRLKLMTEPAEGVDIANLLLWFDKQPAVSNNDKELLARAASQSLAMFEVVNKILRRNADCGVAAKLVREALPGLLSYSPYCRCSGPDKIDRIAFAQGGAYSQLKLNGMFMNIIKDEEGNITYRTRNGKDVDMRGVPDSYFTQVPSRSVVMGEALIIDQKTGMPLPRAAGNALISKGINGQMDEEDANRVTFQLWDYIHLEDFQAGHCAEPYIYRYEALRRLFFAPNDMVVETRVVKSKEEAEAHYWEVRKRYTGKHQLEGTVVKDKSAEWKDGTSLFQVKMKAERECEVMVTGITPGKPGSKYEGKIGSLNFQSSCGVLQGSCSGMTDEVRDLPADSVVGRIMTIRFNEVSTNKNTVIRSLDHARFIEFRNDKNEADSLEYILNL